MYEANVDDVGYRLVAIYTPVREDGVEGQPVSASTDAIAVGIFEPQSFCIHYCLAVINCILLVHNNVNSVISYLLSFDFC